MINESRNLVLSRFYPISPLHSLTQPPAVTRRCGAAGGFSVSGEEGAFLARNFDTTPTKKVVIGTEPIRAPVADIVGHLVLRGHTHPAVSALTTHYLMPFETFAAGAKSPPPLHLWLRGVPDRAPLRVPQALKRRAFYSMQTGRPDIAIHPWALYALTGAANDGSCNVLHPT